MTLILKELKDLIFGNLDLNRRIKIMKNTGIFSIRLSSVLALCLLAALLLAGTALGEVSREGLVAEWHFDESAGNVVKDSSGNGNDGTIHGATWVDGKFGKALSFDATLGRMAGFSLTSSI
jgi:hypothetical protein